MRSWPEQPQVAQHLRVRQLRISLRGQGLKPAQDSILALPDRLVHIDLYAAAPLQGRPDIRGLASCVDLGRRDVRMPQEIRKF